ncbi:MAG: AMP-binding protein [Acidimicrobiales bacterium]|nr:AMP-binding protein [Acidimicrobiales bacterium]MCB1259442.1 AMP-binding protein [Acidimicrobiales bacterium]
MRTAIKRAELLVRRDATLGTIAPELAAVYGDRRLVEEAGGGLRLTYRQAAKRVCRWAGGVRDRVEPGDRVVIAAANSYEMFLLTMAVSRAGAIPVPLNEQMRPDEIRHVIADSGAALTIRSATEIDGAEPVTEHPQQRPSDIAALFYTSGTTGRPKGVELTHQALVGQVVAGVAWPSALRRDEALYALPIAHIMGYVVLMGMACAGIGVFLMPHFHPIDVLDAMERRRSSIFIGVPAMYRMLAEAGAAERDLSSVRLWASGADAMPAELAQQFKKMGALATVPFVGPIGEATFAEGYGLVESAGGVAAKVSPPFLNLGLGDSVGFQLPGYKMRVVDDEGNDVAQGQVGELWVQGPGITKGYWNAPETTAQTVTDDGWLRTGDLARKGPLGTVLFAGRQKDVIKHGGYSVYAVEVQASLEDHPEVLEAAVLGMPHPRVGEVPVAAVRLTEDATLTPERLIAWATEHVAEYKVPHQVVVVDELPRTGTKKVQKDQLRPLFAPIDAP